MHKVPLTKLKGLFLDDERNPEDVTWINYSTNIEWTIVRTLSTFIDEMESNVYDYYSFDHDIQDFWVQPVGTPLYESAFGVVVSDKETRGEYTGYNAAVCLKDYMTLYLVSKLPVGYYVHSKNPVGAENIHNVLGSLFK